MAGTKTIKSSGGDYTSVAAWESGEQGVLTGLGEVKGVIFDVNTTTSTIIAGSSGLSASDFRHLTTDPSFRHAGKWDTSKTNFQFNSLATVVFEIQEAFFLLDYNQLKNTHGSSPTGVVKITNVASVRVEQCITACDVAAGGDDNAGVWVNGASALSTKIRNHVSHGMRNGVYGDNAAQTTEIDNAATVGCTKGIRTVASTGTNMLVKNSYAGGNTNDYDEGGSATPGWTFTTSMCAQNLTITGVTKNIAYSTANFVNVTAGSQDLHLVSGSALINQGTDLSATFTVDINGATRPTGASTWDVGVDEFVAAATQAAVYAPARIGNKFVGPAAQRFLFKQPPLLDTTVAAPGTQAVMPPAAGTRFVGPPALRRLLARPQPLPAFSQSGPNNFTQALSATLSFIGALVKSTAHTGEAGALSFAGALVKRTSTARTATLSFAGSLARSIGKVLTGALSFAGARAVSIGKGLTGTLSFAGSVTRAIALAAKTATLNFAGDLVKRTATARTAALSFAGSVLTGKAFLRAFTATLSFSGAFAKLPNKALAGALSFAGVQSRAIVHTMSAALSFAGSQARRITLAAKTATLSFAGSLVAGHLFTKALTATLSFAGSASRRAGKALAGSLSFVGTRGPTRIGKALSATLGSSGVLTRVSSAVQAVFGWGARGKVGGAAASDPFQRLGSESARDPWQRIGSESADDPFKRIGSESAKAEDDAIGGESAQGTPGKIGSDEA